jgi:hypothetical protein
MRRRNQVRYSLIGIFVTIALFLFLPMLSIVGATDCVSGHPGFRCSIVQFAFSDYAHADNLRLVGAR